MAKVRQTLLVRNVEGLKAKARARTRRQVAAVKAAQEVNFIEEFDLAQGLANRLTNFMADNMVHRLTRGGFNYFLGFIRREFVGKVNPVTQQVVTEPYYEFVHNGTRFYIGNPFLDETRRIMKPRAARRLRRALAA
jgi:hypothetical protein